MLCHYIRSVFGALGIYTLEIGCQWCKKVPRSAIDTPLDEGQLVSRLDIHCCLSCLLNLNGSTLKFNLFSLGGFFCKPIDCDWKDTKFQKDWCPLYQNLHGSTNLGQYFFKSTPISLTYFCTRFTYYPKFQRKWYPQEGTAFIENIVKLPQPYT